MARLRPPWRNDAQGGGTHARRGVEGRRRAGAGNGNARVTNPPPGPFYEQTGPPDGPISGPENSPTTEFLEAPDGRQRLGIAYPRGVVEGSGGQRIHPVRSPGRLVEGRCTLTTPF